MTKCNAKTTRMFFFVTINLEFELVLNYYNIAFIWEYNTNGQIKERIVRQRCRYVRRVLHDVLRL